VAHNTDLPAVAAELRALGPVHRGVVLGNGGASRAVQVALADVGAKVTIVDRARWAELPALLADADLLVNATPIGTASDESPVAADDLRADLAVLDLVYRPSPTRLVREARATGAPAEGGAGVLLAQAALSFEMWTGRHAPVDVMADALRDDLGITADA
jgi:shikimate dehydrogenase